MPTDAQYAANSGESVNLLQCYIKLTESNKCHVDVFVPNFIPEDIHRGIAYRLPTETEHRKNTTENQNIWTQKPVVWSGY